MSSFHPNVQHNQKDTRGATSQRATVSIPEIPLSTEGSWDMKPALMGAVLLQEVWHTKHKVMLELQRGHVGVLDQMKDFRPFETDVR